jgi:glucosamine--fructose-6-phosphate aminotransferase (isomerizing)
VKKRKPAAKPRSAPRNTPRERAASQSGAPTPGHYTLREILSQPAMWAETYANLARNGTIERLAAQFTAGAPWLFVACGSSYYLSQLISAIWSRDLGIRCSAVAASELLFAPEETLRSTGAREVVFISRSGETTEVLRAAEILKKHSDIRTLGVSCNPASPLEHFCTSTFTLPWADEKSTVMTRSFTSILLSFERLGALLTGEAQLAASLNHLPKTAQPWLDANADRIRQLATKRRFADFVFLGQGAHYWLAQEAALKVTEMSASYAQAYHSLEFRHGPRSIAGRDTLITFFISDAAAREETLLAGELKALDAANLIIVNRATPELRAASDLLIPLDLEVPEFARIAVAAIPAQLLGTSIGLRKGLDPDAPKNLTRAVVLGATAAKLQTPAQPAKGATSAKPSRIANTGARV